MDRTLILVKPDAFARGLTGEIIARFERKGLTIVALKHMQIDEDLAKQHYAEHDGQAVLRRARRLHHLAARSSRWCSRASEAVKAARQVIGATNPLEATTGSIRGDFAIEVGQNMVHGSDVARVRPRARRRCSSPSSGVTRLVLASRLAAAPRHPERAAGVEFEVRPAAVVEGDEGRPRSRWRARTRCARRWRCAGGRGERVLGVDTRRRPRRSSCGASRRTPRRRAETLRAPVGPHARGRQRLRPGPRRRR